MACIENIPPVNGDSEMEEGEIVDDLSDVSSEEFLVRERLQVLEIYNNVLERKKAKRTTVTAGTNDKKEEAYDLSRISATELHDYNSQPHYKNFKVQRNVKVHHKPKRRKDEPYNAEVKTRDNKKKSYRPKKKLEQKVICESSEESEDEYRNSRRKLAEAVVVNKFVKKNDKSSLSERLQKMLCGINPEPTKPLNENKKDTLMHIPLQPEENTLSPISSVNADDNLNADIKETVQPYKLSLEQIDLTTEEPNISEPIETHQILDDTVDSVITITTISDELKKTVSKDIISDKDSDEDLEILRQHALKTKTVKGKAAQNEVLKPAENKPTSEDEDSDTTELRLICLKSALLKKAIEMKQKQRLQKKLSQSSNLQDDFILDSEIFNSKINSENNTDVESVDMDIGSDAEDKSKEYPDPSCVAIETSNTESVKLVEKEIPVIVQHEDELEEDEDLLRANLLTALSKNLPNLVNPDIMKSIEIIDKTTERPEPKPIPPTLTNVIPEEKRIIINLNETDSEGEHEATKNLTKMHMKLSEPLDFQQRLDLFLKSTRMEVEKSSCPDALQQPVPPNKNDKFVAKTVNHLPKPEQIEYNELVKRMAELEKIKQARQCSMGFNAIKIQVPVKDTLKPRNVTIESTRLSSMNNLEAQIRNSRKNIAEESAKIMQLKEEETKLSQKYKIVATELRNIKTAIALNRKQQRSVHTCLTKIRLHHQTLLKSSINTHSKINSQIPPLTHMSRLQKENNPKEDITNVAPPKPVKIVPKQVKEPFVQHPRLSIQVDLSSNKKTVKMPSMDSTDKLNVDDPRHKDQIDNKRLSTHPVEEKGGGNGLNSHISDHKITKDKDDYRSPLDAFGNTTWEGDPNAILCPFEVGGECKDGDCKYLHTKARSK